jgi:murein DD-endopeptidase MepM/ murein hydrolase activator NlpD
MTRKTIASVGLVLCLFAISMNSAAARSRHHSDTTPSAIKLLQRQAAAIEQMRQELIAIRRELRPDHVASADATSIIPLPRNRVMAALEAEPMPNPKILDRLLPAHVMPATATQRGQFRDQRRTHRHAGIDLGGVWGSEIVASFGGVVLPAPGRDRGYGPHVIVIKGDDGIIYRYAHLATVAVKIGDRVKVAQRLGTMGKVGAHGFPHLHFEMMRVAEYRRRPYGVHSLDPNDYLGGSRGRRMVAGDLMTGQSASRYAAAH